MAVSRTWLLKYLIMFNIFQLEYIMSDTKGASGQLNRQDVFETITRFKRYLRLIRRRRLVKNDAKENLDDQLARQAIKQETEGNPCLAAPCAHGGVCTWRPNKEPPFTCKCPLGYKGRWCGESIPECDSQPCTEKGSCVATPKGFVCICKEGFDGIYCEEKRKKNETGIVITAEELYEGEIAIGIFGGLVLVIVIILIIHFVRVNKRREEMKAQYHILLAKDDIPPPLPPGICEVSGLLCSEFFCFLCPKRSEALTKYEKSLSKLELKKAYEEVLEQEQKAVGLDEEEPLITGHSMPEQTLSMDNVLGDTFDTQDFRYNTMRRNIKSEIIYDSPAEPIQYYSEPINSTSQNRNTYVPEYSWHNKRDDSPELIHGTLNDEIGARLQRNRARSYTDSPSRLYISTKRGEPLEQQNIHHSYTEAMPRRYSLRRRNEDTLDSLQRDLLNRYQQYNAEELNDEILNVEHVLPPERQESRHSSHVLEREHSRRSPSSKKSLNRLLSPRKWSYNVDPHKIVTRRKSLHESTSQEDTDDRFERRGGKQSRHSLTKRFSQLKHSTSKIREPPGLRHDERNVFTRSHGNIPVPPAPAPAPAPAPPPPPPPPPLPPL